jgi:hypothetical protein
MRREMEEREQTRTCKYSYLFSPMVVLCPHLFGIALAKYSSRRPRFAQNPFRFEILTPRQGC